jgi:hypothetical protein
MTFCMIVPPSRSLSSFALTLRHHVEHMSAKLQPHLPYAEARRLEAGWIDPHPIIGSLDGPLRRPPSRLTSVYIDV